MRASLLLAGLGFMAGMFLLSSCSTGSDDGPETTAVIDPAALEALGAEDEIEVLVTLRQLDLPPEQRTMELEREHTAEVERRVLATLTEADFTLINQFESTPALHGLVTQSGVEKLAANPDVVDLRLTCCLYEPSLFPRPRNPKPSEYLHLRPDDPDFDTFVSEFADFPLYWLGNEFRGYPLEGIIRNVFSPGDASPTGDSVTLLYGSCDPPEGEGGCAVPVSVTVEPYCLVPPELIGHGTRPADIEQIRGGADALTVGDGLRIWTGPVTVKVYAAGLDRDLEASDALVSSNGLGPAQPGDDLPPPDRDCSEYEWIPHR